MKGKDNRRPSFYAIDSLQESQGESFSHSLLQLQEHPEKSVSPATSNRAGAFSQWAHFGSFFHMVGLKAQRKATFLSKNGRRKSFFETDQKQLRQNIQLIYLWLSFIWRKMIGD